MHINLLSEHTGIGIGPPDALIDLSWGGPIENAGQYGRMQYFSGGDKRNQDWSAYGPGWGSGDKIGIGIKVVSGSLQMIAFKNGVDLGEMYSLGGQSLSPHIATWLPANNSNVVLDITLPSRRNITLPTGFQHW